MFGSPRSQPFFKALGQLGVRFAGNRQHRQLVLGFIKNRFDDAVHQQVWVAPNRAGEMGVRIKCQAEVPIVYRRVNGLLHGAQQHGVDLLRIGTVFGRVGYFLKLTGHGVVTDRQPEAGDLEVIAKNLDFFGRGALMNAEQTRVLALGNEVCAADIGRQHGLFNQLVRIVAGARHNFLYAPAFITNNLRLHRLKINRTPTHPRLEQGLVNIVQIQQIVHPGFAFDRLRAARVGQNGGHLVVSKARMAEHHGGVKLVGRYLAVFAHHHVAHHAQALDFRVQRAQTI